MTHDDPHPRNRIAILDTEMSFIDVGEGAPIVFLHGNPTSSYSWRNIIPHVSDLGRCLAPDLVGMGQSGRSPTYSYRFVDHARYLDAWFDALAIKNAVLVVHDWGGALGFHWAHRHPDRVAALAHMEAIVQPLRWSGFGEAGAIFKAFRSAEGERLILQENAFIEQVLPAATMRTLGEQEMDAYRAPFRDAATRLPMLVWPRQIPIDAEPADVVAVVEAYGRWLAESRLPKLFIAAEPGAIVAANGPGRSFCRTWPNQTEVTVRGIHFVQEDSPREIGAALREFVARVRSGGHASPEAQS